MADFLLSGCCTCAGCHAIAQLVLEALRRIMKACLSTAAYPLILLVVAVLMKQGGLSNMQCAPAYQLLSSALLRT